MRPRTRTDHEGYVSRSKVDPSGSKCGKFRYSSKKVALATAREQRRLSGENVQSYHCFACHCYHLGHVPGEPRRIGA